MIVTYVLLFVKMFGFVFRLGLHAVIFAEEFGRFNPRSGMSKAEFVLLKKTQFQLRRFQNSHKPQFGSPPIPERIPLQVEVRDACTSVTTYELKFLNLPLKMWSASILLGESPYPAR